MADAQFDRLKTALADRYSIERELGSGGTATVYLAEDLKHKRKVAVKVLRPELAAVLGAERFVQEIKTTANLQHPHILPPFDSGEADAFGWRYGAPRKLVFLRGSRKWEVHHENCKTLDPTERYSSVASSRYRRSGSD